MRTENIYLRKLVVSDASAYHKSMQDEEIMFMTGTKSQATIKQIEAYIKNISEDDSREEYAICSIESNEMIGELSLMDIDLDNHSAGFRIALNDKRYFGKGLGSEAINLIIDYVFNIKNLNRLQLEVYSHNPRGIRAYEKCGFKQEGILRQALYFKGKYSDEIIMAIIKDDYLSLNNNKSE